MTSVINATRIVLQGEFAVVKADDVLIKTTIPKTCSVFTLYNLSFGFLGSPKQVVII